MFPGGDSYHLLYRLVWRGDKYVSGSSYLNLLLITGAYTTSLEDSLLLDK